jgi:uncharacterized protein YqjF (DUF2071 family)
MPHDFNHAILTDVAHRPWPLPERPWVMTQTWHDLLFAHWPIDPAVLRARVPRMFTLDLFGGRAWLGIVPFRMSNVAPRGVPALPWISAFPELNVRTYVRVEHKPGVFFFSLDAGNPLAVQAAWTLFNLPYYSASMVARSRNGTIDYRSRRRSGGRARLIAAYAPTAPASPPAAGSLEYFLTERYCLYHVDHRRRPYRLDIHHPPWPLQPADADIRENTMAEAAGIVLPDTAPLLHFSRRQDMVAWWPSPVRRL